MFENLAASDGPLGTSCVVTGSQSSGFLFGAAFVKESLP